MTKGVTRSENGDTPALPHLFVLLHGGEKVLEGLASLVLDLRRELQRAVEKVGDLRRCGMREAREQGGPADRARSPKGQIPGSRERTWSKCSSVKPRVVSAGVPMRTAPGARALRSPVCKNQTVDEPQW